MIDRVISGHYKILREIGAGGMGIVYLARDLELERFVALKFLRGDVADEEKQWFIDEARKLSALRNNHICDIYHIGTADGQMFMCMPYLEGETLRDKIERGALAIGRAVDFAIQIAEALCEVHRHGMVHGDIKASNTILTNEGVVKLVDFGLARLIDVNGASQPGAIAGSLPFMSPEQLATGNATSQSDIWSLGALLYAMYTGQMPFTSIDPAALVDEICNRLPTPIWKLRPESTPELERIVLMAMEKSPANRYQTIEEMLTDLKSLQNKLELEKTSEMPQNLTTNKTRIAVLPLKNHCPNREEDQYFVNGMAAALNYSLSNIKGLNVIASTSVEQYRQTSKSIAEIGRELRVGTAIEGSVCRDGKSLRIIANLVDTVSQENLWSQEYKREITDVFAIQSDISKQVAEALKVQLVADERQLIKRKTTKNIEAYDSYLKGLASLSKRTRTELQAGIEHFGEAIRRDPGYASAYAGLADCYTMLSAYGDLQPVEVLQKAKENAERALQLDDTLAEAYASRGYVRLWLDWNWMDAERDFKQAIALNDSYTTAHQWYSEYLMAMRRPEEAIEKIKRASQDLDPHSPLINWHLGRIFYLTRKYDEAIQQFQRTLELDAAFGPAHRWLGQAYEQKGMHLEAVAEYLKAKEISGDSPKLIAALKKAYDTSGMKGFRRKRLARLLEVSNQGYVPAYKIALEYAYLGEKDEAFKWLEKACDDKSGWVVLLKVDPWLDTLRSDLRFVELTRRVGLPSLVSNAAGFWGDWPEAPIKQVEEGPIDYLTLDYLAEVTMSILAKQKGRREKEIQEWRKGEIANGDEPSPLGYATDFVPLMRKILKPCVERNIKVITNAGGLNPEACAQAVIKVARELGINDVKVMYVAGDDIFKQDTDFIKERELEQMGDKSLSDIPISQIRSANVYFGAEPIVDVLRQGAQVVVTGRCTDTGLTLAPLMYEFGWGKDEFNSLATGVVAGHIIECGATSTGGNCQSAWQSIPDWKSISDLDSEDTGSPIRKWIDERVNSLANIGYPIIEAHVDGSFVVTKHERSGGQVTVETVKEQLLYELGEPDKFITPECIAEFSSIELEQLGLDRVLVKGIAGRAPTDTYKVSICYADGWKAVGSIVYSWPDAYLKAFVADQVIKKRLEKIGLEFDEILTEFIGANACHGPRLAPEPSSELAEVELRIAVRKNARGQSESELARDVVERFCRELPPLILNGPPTAIGFSEGRPQPKEIIAYAPALIRKSLVKPTYGPNGGIGHSKKTPSGSKATKRRASAAGTQSTK